MKGIFTLLLITIIFCHSEAQKLHSKKIPIAWVDSLPGDYSFANQWSYNENIFKNNYSQLVCDGDCPERSYRMTDSMGRIYQDSIAEYYKLIDTTYWYHTLECQGWTYEFGGADYIDVKRYTNGMLHLVTPAEGGTHCSLNLMVDRSNCTPAIHLKSIAPGGDATFYCKSGYIKIDSTLWKKGIVKAEFSFDFYHPENPKQRMYWKGKIFTRKELSPERSTSSFHF